MFLKKVIHDTYLHLVHNHQVLLLPDDIVYLLKTRQFSLKAPLHIECRILKNLIKSFASFL
jgi:hypothetical protein